MGEKKISSFTTVSFIPVHLVYGNTDVSYTANKMPLTNITNEIFNQQYRGDKEQGRENMGEDIL